MPRLLQIRRQQFRAEAPATRRTCPASAEHEPAKDRHPSIPPAKAGSRCERAHDGLARHARLACSSRISPNSASTAWRMIRCAPSRTNSLNSSRKAGFVKGIVAPYLRPWWRISYVLNDRASDNPISAGMRRLLQFTPYTRSDSNSFEEAENLHRTKPKSVNYEIYYATCLALRAQGNDAADGLIRLRRIAKQHNHVFAALFATEYVETGGRFQAPIDFDNINEAIFGYGQVLAYINWEGNSYPQSEPIDYTLYENSDQMELRAYYRIPTLYRSKFIRGFKGTYNRYLLTSPSYTGKRDLKTYPQYSPYTQHSLDKVIESANRCLFLPPKRHFKPNRYSFNKKACKVLKEEAIALRSLEDKRLVLLATESCRRDLPNCKEYNEIHQQMMDCQIWCMGSEN